MWRFYRMEIWPDLLGGALLMRQWGRRHGGAPPARSLSGRGRCVERPGGHRAGEAEARLYRSPPFLNLSENDRLRTGFKKMPIK
jgi:hypothetical protein